MDARRAWDKQYRWHGALWRGERPSALGEVPKHARVLELGCGNGKGLLPLLDEGRSPVGLDFARSALRGLRRTATERHMRPDLVAADAVHCPFRDASFDVVLNHHVLPHLLAPGRAALLRECARVLVPDGMLSLEVFAVDDLRFGKGDEVEPSTFRRGSGILVHHFRAEELRGAVVDAGFAVASERKTVQTKLYAGRQVRRSILSLVGRKKRARGPRFDTEGPRAPPIELGPASLVRELRGDRDSNSGGQSPVA